MLTIKHANSDNPDFKFLAGQLDIELNSRYGTVQLAYNQYNKINLIETVAIAYLNGKPAGCGCFKEISENTVEIKRMFVSKEARGNGIGTKLLKELEEWAIELNYAKAVLETGKAQPEAIRLYQKSGYSVIDNYGQYVGMENSICMSKTLKS